MKKELNKLFLDGFVDKLEENNKFNIRIVSQSQLKYLIEDNIDEFGDDFPMICYEYTNDSDVEVDISESKFLNDKEHDGTWLIGESHGELSFLMCLIDDEDEIEIDAFEVSKNQRGEGLSTYILDSIEYVSSYFYDKIYISPFDTDAMNFWKHQGYEEDYGGYYTKILNDDDEY